MNEGGIVLFHMKTATSAAIKAAFLQIESSCNGLSTVTFASCQIMLPPFYVKQRIRFLRFLLIGQFWDSFLYLDLRQGAGKPAIRLILSFYGMSHIGKPL